MYGPWGRVSAEEGRVFTLTYTMHQHLFLFTSCHGGSDLNNNLSCGVPEGGGVGGGILLTAGRAAAAAAAESVQVAACSQVARHCQRCVKYTLPCR